MQTLESARHNVRRLLALHGPLAQGRLRARLSRPQREHLSRVLEELVNAGEIRKEFPRGAHPVYRWGGGEAPTDPAGHFIGDVGDSASYMAVHHRLRRQRGYARDHLCIDCERPAHQWSYTQDDPEERRGISKHGRTDCRPYSLDLGRYVPRCYSCHSKADRRSG